MIRARRSVGVVALVVLALVVVQATGGVGGLGGSDSDARPSVRFESVGESVGFQYTPNGEMQLGNGRTSVYVGDYDRNGYPDVLAIGGDEPVVFENTGGSFQRADVLPSLNVTVKSALFFDRDGDGLEDLLLLTRYGPPVFLENVGERFERRDVGLSNHTLQVPTTAAAADFDRDGCLDLLVVQNGDWAVSSPARESLGRSTGHEDPRFATVDVDNGVRNQLWLGDCEAGTFTDVTESVGIDGERWTTTASFVDFNGDGYPDVHAANDYNHDYLYVNRNGTSFEPRRIPGTNRHAMASEVADFDRDGRPDVFVTNVGFDHGRVTWMQTVMQSMNNRGNNLLLNTGEGFQTSERAYNVTQGGWGWAAVAVDFENDGDRDLVHTTKFYRRGDDRSSLVRTPPAVWTRGDDGFVRRNATALGFERADGRGLAHLDFDRDGDQDLIVGSLDGAFRLYENRGTHGNWLQIDLRDDRGARVPGATVVVHADQSHHLVTNSRTGLQSQSTRTRHVGVGDAKTVTVEVTWPDGTTDRFEDVSTNQRVRFGRDGTVRVVPKE